MRVSENVEIAGLTTLGVGGPARRLAFATTAAEICAAATGEVLFLGGGSNLVVADEGFAGTVVRIASRGRAAHRDGEHVVVTVEAGEVWDDLVTWACAESLAGIECLAGIPGLVGATPMQNVGAYGQDVAQTIRAVRVFDRAVGKVVDLDAAACDFAYRSSLFRGRDRWVILSVTFALSPSGESRPLRYAELTQALGIGADGRAPLGLVRETVIALRRRKGMVLDPADADTRSAGSFFTNPILDAAALAALRTRVDVGLPVFPDAGGRSKVSAAWLIERAGFAKGYRRGNVAVSGKHALALTNRGGATTRELVELAREIRDGVQARFGVTLEHEPILVGITL